MTRRRAAALPAAHVVQVDRDAIVRDVVARLVKYRGDTVIAMPRVRTWIAWTNRHGNKHAAIIEKANEIGALAWDFGQADHEMLSRAGF